MADSKWDKADALMQAQHRTTALTPDATPVNPLAPIEVQIEELRQRRLGIIGSFKRNGIERKAALNQLQELHNAQMESTKHALEAALAVDKRRIDVIADKYIFHLDEEYLKDLRELGIKNFESRMTALLQLNTSAARLMEAAEAQDVPPAMKQTTLQGIIKKHQEFFDRVMAEETRLPQ
ncbi:MAG TPA: hypothetical protein VG225_05165 [Terracidiphilus sp.]|nr:hypothetical protein [Terracidiphilus sp.]